MSKYNSLPEFLSLAIPVPKLPASDFLAPRALLMATTEEETRMKPTPKGNPVLFLSLFPAVWIPDGPIKDSPDVNDTAAKKALKSGVTSEFIIMAGLAASGLDLLVPVQEISLSLWLSRSLYHGILRC